MVELDSTLIFRGSPPAGGQETVNIKDVIVYAVYNKENGKVYIGQTLDIQKRLREHNEKRGNNFTVKFDGEWILIYKEQAEERKKALIREKQLKSYRGRKFIKQFIPI